MASTGPFISVLYTGQDSPHIPGYGACDLLSRVPGVIYHPVIS